MDLKSYFEDTSGRGIFSTADSEGNVDSAIYARPHVMKDGTIAFIMRNRLSRKNLESNPKAAYMFIEDGPGYRGRRFFLKKIKEDNDMELINALKRRNYAGEENTGEDGLTLVHFEITGKRPLIGG